MARRFEGQSFYVGYNNGVQAIAHENVVRNTDLRNRIANWHEDVKNGFQDYDLRREHAKAALDALGHIPTTPVFTFADFDRMQKQPWFTGTHDDAGALLNYLRAEGANMAQGLYVPFSNALEIGVHGIEAMQRELRYVTTGEQFREVFGLTLANLRAAAAAMARV